LIGIGNRRTLLPALGKPFPDIFLGGLLADLHHVFPELVCTEAILRRHRQRMVFIYPNPYAVKPQVLDTSARA
jgi:hypothetical protein